MDEARYAKRARQACEPCRKKKSKCPGERPICSYCERLGQQCVYNSSAEVVDMHQTKHNREMEHRMNSLEDKMDRLIQHLSPDPQPRRPSSSNPIPSPKPSTVTEVAVSRHESRPAPNKSPSSISVVTETHLNEIGRLYLTWCHSQPITLFHEESFLTSLATRDPELILSLQALVLRFSPGSLTVDAEQQLNTKARSARRMVMERVTEGRVELSTLQSLCLLSMFDFATGNVTQSGLNLSIATHLSHSIRPSRNQRTAHELNLCLRGIAALQNLQGCIVPATASLHNTSHNLSLAPCTSPSLSHLDDAAPDNNISTLASHFSVTWRLARAYAASRVSPDAPPPWDSRSDYSTVMQSHHDIDCRASAKYRFACNRIGDYSPEAIQAQRHWWMPFLFIQFVHETIPCLLNHPFLLSMRLRSFRQTIPVYFMQQSFEAINRNAGWVIYFVDVLEKKGVQVSDPVLAHCVVIVATIHLQHSFVQDDLLRGKAQTGFEKCMRFLRRMAAVWPCVANMANNLRRLQDSIVLRPSPAQQDGSSQSQSFSINSQLLWDLLIYDKAVRPDAGWDQSMFGPTLKADVAELSAEDRAAEFDLVGSAGISGHKAMPNEAAVWPPNEDPPPVDLPQNAGLDAQVGDLAGGPSFEDIFFEGVGPFGDQANRFFDGNDYGRAIDDWLNLGT